MNTFKQKICRMPSLLLFMVIMFSGGCAWFATRQPPPPLNRHEIAEIVSVFENQENAVRTLFSTGTLKLDSQGAQSEAEVLIIARRDPSSIRIEITHQWGRPLLHIQVNGSRLDVISFSEKRHYQGRLGTPRMLKQVPFPLDPDLIWSLARAYPVLLSYHHLQSTKDHQVTLTDEQDAAIQIIDLYPDHHPQRVLLCRQGIVMGFSDYQDQSGLLYAGNIQLTDREKTTLLTLDVKQMAFNRPLPEAIFRQEAPPGFELVQL